MLVNHALASLAAHQRFSVASSEEYDPLSNIRDNSGDEFDPIDPAERPLDAVRPSAKRRRDNDDDAPRQKKAKKGDGGSVVEINRERARQARKSKYETPRDVVQMEDEFPGLLGLNPDRLDQHEREMSDYNDNVGSVAASRGRRNRQRVDYAQLANGQRIDGAGLAVVHVHDLKRKHVVSWKKGSGVRFHGGSITLHPVPGSHPVYLEVDQHKKALKAIQKAQHVVLRVSHRAGHFTAQQVGGGFFSDVWSGLKKGVDFVANKVRPVVGSIATVVLDALPHNQYTLATRAALKVVTGLAEGLDKLINNVRKQRSL